MRVIISDRTVTGNIINEKEKSHIQRYDLGIVLEKVTVCQHRPLLSVDVAHVYAGEAARIQAHQLLGQPRDCCLARSQRFFELLLEALGDRGRGTEGLPQLLDIATGLFEEVGEGHEISQRRLAVADMAGGSTLQAPNFPSAGEGPL